MNKISEVIPHPLLKQSVKTSNLTMIVSSVPGLPDMDIFNGLKLKDMAFFTPHVGGTGQYIKYLYIT